MYDKLQITFSTVYVLHADQWETFKSVTVFSVFYNYPRACSIRGKTSRYKANAAF